MSERKESSSAYTRPAGGATSGTSSGTRDYLRVYFGSDITTGTMYGTMSTYYNSVQDFAENLEDFPDFGGGEQLRYLAPMSPGPESPAPASFTAPPQTRAFTAPPAIQPPGPVEGGEEEPGTLGTVWYYAWEYGGEFVPLVGSGRGFKRAYDEGSTLGMAWNGFIFGVEATGVGAALGLIGKGGKAAVATSKVAASGLRPMVSGMASAAKAKAVEAVSVAKSTVSDAVGAVGNKLDGLGERLAGLFGGGGRIAPEVKVERGWLQFWEGRGIGNSRGHVIAEHVGKSDADLISRLGSNNRIRAASSFTNQATAEAVISEAIRQNRNQVSAWLRTAQQGDRRMLIYSGSDVIGRGISRGQSVVADRTNARIILQALGDGKYHILTAFPE